MGFQTFADVAESIMSDDEDDYVAFGVSLKPLEEGDTIRKKPIALEEQIKDFSSSFASMQLLGQL